MSRMCLTSLILVTLLVPSTLFGKTTEIVINTAPDQLATRSPRQLEIQNGEEVKFTIKKSLVEVCTVETKREEVEPEPNPLITLISTLSAGFKPAGAGGCNAQIAAEPARPADPPVTGEVRARLVLLNGNLDDIENGSLVEYQKLLLPVVQRVKELTSCRFQARLFGKCSAGKCESEFGNQVDCVLDGDGNVETCTSENGESLACAPKAASECAVRAGTPPFCRDGQTYLNKKGDIEGAIVSLLRAPAPAFDSADLDIARLQAALKEIGAFSATQPAELVAWLQWADKSWDCTAARLKSLRDAANSLIAQRDVLAKVLETSRQYPLELAKDTEETLAADQDSKVTGSVSCKNYYTNAPTIRPVPFTLVYQKPPRFTVGTGLLYSALDKEKFGTEAVRTGGSTFKTVFAVTEESTFQVVPFTFISYPSSFPSSSCLTT